MTITIASPAVLADLTIDTDSPIPNGMREPDFYDRERAYWIGPEASVSCWTSADLSGIVDVLERAGWMARTGQKPSRNGLVVEPHNPEVKNGPLQVNGRLFTLWEMARETILQDA